jgi:signal peptidase I
MKESLHDGDIVFVVRWNYHPHVGDIVITNKNNLFQERIIKRVAAINDEEAVYLIGDNAGYSLDSRKIGYVSLSNVMGKVVFRLYPRPASFISGNGRGS